MDPKANIKNADEGTTLVLGSNDLFDVRTVRKDSSVGSAVTTNAAVVNSIAAGSTITLKRLLNINAVTTNNQSLTAVKAGWCNVSSYSKTFFTLQSAATNQSGELVYTFKAIPTKTTSPALPLQLPGIVLNYGGDDSLEDKPPGPFAKSQERGTFSIYLFQIA